MRIRLPFAGAFSLLLFVSAFFGLTTTHIPSVNDKVLHFVTFFVLTLTFYWILDASRRRTLNTTVLVITFLLGIGSEVLQALLPNDRQFDPFDILANVVGSLIAIGLCSMYHKRMLERKRKRKLEGYGIMPQDGEEDLELGEGGSAEQEIGVVDPNPEDLDETEAWDELGGEESVESEGDKKTPSSSGPDE